MAKKSALARNAKREYLVAKYAKKRDALKQVLADPNTSDEDFFSAQRKLNKIPRNASPVRLRNRCSITGRPRAYNRRFGLSRITLRELASSGKIPGVVKSSW